MGFTSGFTGGVTLTLSLAYLGVLAHQHNRRTQGDVLRAQTQVLGSLARDPSFSSTSSPASLSTAVAAAALTTGQEPDLVRTAKAKWNEEVRAAARWAQTKDWSETRETVETVLDRLLGLGLRSEEGATVTTAAVSGGGDSGRGPASAARGALEETKSKPKPPSVAPAPTATSTKAGGSGESGSTLTDGEGVVLQKSDVERALSQRYEKSDAMGRSVKDILSERYQSIGERDNTKLRGL